MKNNRPFRYRKILVMICIAFAVFGMVQISAPVIQNPPITKEINLPTEVSRILMRSCYDCHSNEIKLAWYEKIAPAAYFASGDIMEGGERFNFSQWGDNSPAVQELINQFLIKYW